jgi:hypothetical protein
MRCVIALLIAIVALLTAPQLALAQRLVVSGALQRDLQRFPQDVVPNRLDGAAIGVTFAALAHVWRGFTVTAEWSDGGTIEDVRRLTLDANGGTVTLSSTLAHRTRAWLTLAGFGHRVSSRVRVAWLGGAAFSSVRRQFRSDAAGLVLVSPSDSSGTAPPIVDRFRTVAGGVNVYVQVTEHLQAVSGLRAQPVRLSPDLDGWSARLFAGAGWVF